MTARIRRRPRRSLFLAATTVALIALFMLIRPGQGAHATSGGSPYDNPSVVDTNSAANIVETSLVAKAVTVGIGNGVTAHAETFNGSIPGPTFHLNVGDTVIVHYVNHLPYASGIHWHGIELENAMDGTPFTQDQVPPGGTFLYKFKVSRPGIFWYHPHHHSSTNQVFKGLYGMILVTDPNDAALVGSGTLPPATDTLPIVLSDTTVCKAPGSNDALTYNTSLPWVGPGALPAQASPHPVDLCETSPIDENGNPLSPPGTKFQQGDIPNIQTAAHNGRENEGQTVLTNGVNAGARAGTPSSPGALDPSGPAPLNVVAGQGLRLQILNAAAIRYMRLRLTDGSGNPIPLVRVGGEGGLLDSAVVEGGVISGFDTGYGSGEILLPPGSRADVVAAIPLTEPLNSVLTMWTEDYSRTGQGFSNVPTVPVMNMKVTGTAGTAYVISPGTALRTATGNPVPVLGPASASLLNPASFSPAKLGLAAQNIQLTQGGGGLSIDNVFGTHDVPPPYSSAPHLGSTRYARIGDTLELTAENTTQAHHPFHLHGFSMQPIDLTKSGSPTYTWPYHEFRDNIDIPPGYKLRFRIKIEDRPLADGTTMGGALGRWLFHCHIFFHATNGMLGELVIVNSTGNEKPDVNTVADGVSNGTTSHVNAPGDVAAMDGVFHDPDGDPVTLSPSKGSITMGAGTWSWSFNTTGEPLGSQYVYITATDSHGLKDEAVFRLKIGNAADGSDDGDPHLEAVDGTHYDFQSVGEFTLLKDSDTGLEVQTRQTPVTTASPVTDGYSGLTACVSINTAAAVEVGPHRIAYEPAPGERKSLLLYVDGVLRKLSTTGIPLGSNGRVVSYPLSGGAQAVEVDAPDGSVITISPWFWSANNVWLLNVHVSHSTADEGLLGRVRNGWLPSLSTGGSLGPRPASLTSRYIELYKTFAQSWRVTPSSSLFAYAPGTSTATFTYTAWPPIKPPCKVPARFAIQGAHPSLKNIDPRVAAKYCAKVKIPALNKDCVFDVATTGDPKVAQSYLQSQQLQLQATTVRVRASSATSPLGKAVAVAATVAPLTRAGKAVPTGTLRFTVDGRPASPALKVDRRGVVTFKLQKLAAGDRQLGARFTPAQGSAFLPSSSPAILHTVVAPVTPCKGVSLTVPSGQHPGVGGRDPNTSFRTGPDSTPLPAFVVPSVEGWDTIPNTNWVSLNAKRASSPGKAGFPYRTSYQTSFTLPSGSPNGRESLALSLTVLADDGATVFLNDHQFGSQSCELRGSDCSSANQKLSDSNTFTDKTQSDFVPGINTIKLRVLDERPPFTAVDYAATVACAAAG